MLPSQQTSRCAEMVLLDCSRFTEEQKAAATCAACQETMATLPNQNWYGHKVLIKREEDPSPSHPMNELCVLKLARIATEQDQKTRCLSTRAIMIIQKSSDPSTFNPIPLSEDECHTLMIKAVQSKDSTQLEQLLKDYPAMPEKHLFETIEASLKADNPEGLQLLLEDLEKKQLLVPTSETNKWSLLAKQGSGKDLPIIHPDWDLSCLGLLDQFINTCQAAAAAHSDSEEGGEPYDEALFNTPPRPGLGGSSAASVSPPAPRPAPPSSLVAQPNDPSDRDVLFSQAQKLDDELCQKCNQALSEVKTRGKILDPTIKDIFNLAESLVRLDLVRKRTLEKLKRLFDISGDLALCCGDISLLRQCKLIDVWGSVE